MTTDGESGSISNILYHFDLNKNRPKNRDIQFKARHDWDDHLEYPGICLIEPLPKWRMSNPEDEYDNAFASMIPLHHDDGRTKLALHADNATVNTGQKYRAFSAENGRQLAMLA
jgi:hypothetical protein